MPSALPVELREGVVEARRDGEQTLEEIGELFKVHPSTVKRWVKRDKRGDLAPTKQKRGPAPLFDEEQLALLERILERNTDGTIEHLIELFNARTRRAA